MTNSEVPNVWVAIFKFQGYLILAMNGVYITECCDDSLESQDIIEAAGISLANMNDTELLYIDADEHIDEVEDGESSALINEAVAIGLVKRAIEACLNNS